MNIENDIFKRTVINTSKLINYGFKKEDNIYTYEKIFMNNHFKAIITVDENKILTGKIIDLLTNEEYTNHRTEMIGEYVSTIRKSYKKILLDIKNACAENRFFIYDQTNRINNFIKTKYNINPDFLWEKYPGYAIYRQTKKWFALIGNVQENKVNKKSKSTEEIEVLNIKVPKDNIVKILSENGYYEAYHMNKKNWVSIILNETLKDEEIERLLIESYNIVNR